MRPLTTLSTLTRARGMMPRAMPHSSFGRATAKHTGAMKPICSSATVSG